MAGLAPGKRERQTFRCHGCQFIFFFINQPVQYIDVHTHAHHHTHVLTHTTSAEDRTNGV